MGIPIFSPRQEPANVIPKASFVQRHEMAKANRAELDRIIREAKLPPPVVVAGGDVDRPNVAAQWGEGDRFVTIAVDAGESCMRFYHLTGGPQGETTIIEAMLPVLAERVAKFLGEERIGAR